MIPNQETFETSNVAGGQTVESLPFSIVYVDVNSIKVNVDGVDYTDSQYNVSGQLINFTPPLIGLPSGTKIIVYLDVTPSRENDVLFGSPIFSDEINRSLDRLTLAVQQGNVGHDRSILVPFGDETSRQLPMAEMRAKKALVFDENGNVGVGADDYDDQAQKAKEQADIAIAQAEIATEQAEIATSAVENIISFSKGLQPVTLCFISHQTLSGLPAQSGYQTVDGDRVVCIGQNTADANLVYVVHAGAWTKASDSLSSNTLLNAWVRITKGTYASQYVLVNSLTPASGNVAPTSVGWTNPIADTSLYLASNSNQITLGSGFKTTISTIAITADRICRIPDATTNTVQPLISPVPNQWVQYIDTNGLQTTAQPAFNNISGSINTAQLPNGGVNGNNELVQLDNLGKLPALDGSQLTNLSGSLNSSANNLTVSINGGSASSAVDIVNSVELELIDSDLLCKVNGVESNTISVQPLISPVIASNNLVAVNTDGKVIDSGFSVNTTDPFTNPSSTQITDNQSLYNFIVGITSAGNGLLPVTLCFTDNRTLSGLPTQGGYTCLDGDRVVCTGQTNQAENLIYVVHSGAWTIAHDSTTVAQLLGAWTSINKGTYATNYTYVANIVPPSGNVTPTNVIWATPVPQGLYQAGSGLLLTGSVFSIANTAVTAGSYTVNNKALFTVNSKGQLTNANNVLLRTVDITDISSSIATDAQMLISNGTLYSPRSLSGAITVTNTGVTALANSIVNNSNLANMPANTLKGNNTGSLGVASDLTIPQVLAMFSGSSPSFTALSLTNNTNQVTLGTTNTTTITMATLTANRTFSLPNANSNSVQPLSSATANNWVQYIDANGVQNLARPNTRSLSDVASNLPSNNQVLIYSGISQQYIPQIISGAISLTSLGVTTLNSNVVANSNLAVMAGNTLKGNNTGSSGTPADLTVSQVLSMFGFTPSSNQVLYSTSTGFSTTSGTLTTNKPLVATAGGAPTWSAITLPSSVAVNSLVYASSANTLSELVTTADAVLITNSSKMPLTSSTLPVAVQENITKLGTIDYAVYVNSPINISYGASTWLTNSNSNQSMANGSTLGTVFFGGAIDNTGTTNGASISATTTQTWSGLNNGAQLNFNVIPLNSTSLATPMQLRSNRLLTIDCDLNALTTTSSTFGSVLALQNAIGTPTALDAVLGSIIYAGSTSGTNLANQTIIRSVATQNWTSSARGTKLSFLITQNSSTVPVEGFTIENDRSVSTQSGTSGAGRLHYAYRTSGVLRFATGLQVAESGTNSGSNLNFWSYDDTGAFLYKFLSFERNTNQILIDGGVGSKSTQPARMQIVTDTTATTGLVFAPSTNVSFTPVSFRTNTNGIIGSISCTTTNTAFNTSSDYRLKDNIVEYQNALIKLDELRPVEYTWKIDGSYSDGFIAHELQEVLPHAVTGEKDGDQMQQVDYSKVVPLLTAALKELREEVKQLKQQIKELQND